MEEKFLEKYIEAVGGEEAAVRKLSKLARKSEQARRMLEVLTSKSVVRTSKSSCQHEGIVVNRQLTTRRRFTHPMEKVSRICDLLGVSVDDVEIDDEYNVYIHARWIKGHAVFNGKRITIPAVVMAEKSQLLKEGYNIKFKVMGVSRDGRVIAEPICNVPGRRFTAVVQRTARSIMVKADKRVVIPKQFMQTVLLHEGVWEMQALRENDFGVIAKPVKPVTNTDDVADPVSEQMFQRLKDEGKIIL